jgi:hypothetical protein
MGEYKQAIFAAQVVGETQMMSIVIPGKKQSKKQKSETPAGSRVTSTSEGTMSKQRKTCKPKHVRQFAMNRRMMVLDPIDSRMPLYHSLTTVTAGQEHGMPGDSAAISTPKESKRRRKVIKPWDTMVSKLARVQPQSHDALPDALVAGAIAGGSYCEDLSAPPFTSQKPYQV